MERRGVIEFYLGLKRIVRNLNEIYGHSLLSFSQITVVNLSNKILRKCTGQLK